MNAQCRMCRRVAPLVKAHVIPEAFFRVQRDGKEVPLLVAGRSDTFPKKAPIGVYDREILCAACEARFLQPDTYAAEVFLGRFDKHFRPLELPSKKVAFEGPEVDKAKVLLFLASIIWRASVSTHPFYKQVQLGEFEETLRVGLLENPQSVALAIDAVLSRWDDADDGSLPTTALMSPHQERWGTIEAYRLYLGKVVVYIKVDDRAFEEPFSVLSLRAGGPCRIVVRQLSTSKDLQVMQKVARAARKPKSARQAGGGAA